MRGKRQEKTKAFLRPPRTLVESGNSTRETQPGKPAWRLLKIFRFVHDEKTLAAFWKIKGAPVVDKRPAPELVPERVLCWSNYRLKVQA